MKNQRLLIVFAPIILLVGTAAFIAGRMLNNNIGPFNMFGFGGNKAPGVSISLIPAKELPTADPDLIGLFVERADNTIIVQSTSLKTGGKGIVVHKNEDGSVSPSSNMNYETKVEVVLTQETVIYRDTTQISKHPADGNTTIQQTVAISTLGDLAPQSSVIVWGRKSGDRIIADVILYQ